ncbi:hypothetical protein LJC60_04765 [Ruminococcaceae bacterium OttesenSCG-928-D13]|nr:hypothetical protein [Ruminococcaceae bacterium OttesenSCG-928-D13]
MPECYTHVWLGNQALMRSGNTVASRPAYIAGANGPDPFFMYRLWKQARKPDLPALALRMRHEKTGEFLCALINGASTPVQQSFVLGYIVNYTNNCTLSPYFDAMTAPGAPYARNRWHLGADLDSELYYRDYKTRLVPLHAGTPVLITDDLAQVATLLREAIRQVYGLETPLLALADAYHDNIAIRRRMISPSGMRKPFLRLWQPKRNEKYGGPLTARMQPGKKLKRLPMHWQNPHTGEEMDLLLDEVLALSEQTAALCITATMRYWLGEFSAEKLITLLGDNDYDTGLPCAYKAAPPKEKPTETGDGEHTPPTSKEEKNQTA